ncbi:ArsR/SmtB family transcription factor [Pseudonocardia spinosispora]|uniref:ArsR/SmtB family transcription factor n=1 Tax=Pseudonocardia spinosispora TaxID=103441 RepID=UPI000408D3B2|nr:metalloregulator ArsR/SmtB family transcription factor [Pseudonocardia spinosispora]
MRAHNDMATASAVRQPDDGSDGEVLAVAAQVLTHLADPTRLSLIRLLAGGEQDVGTLTAQVAASRSSVSQHLGRLRLAGLVSSHREGRRMLYRVTSGHLVALADQAFGYAEHLVRAVPDHHRHPSV